MKIGICSALANNIDLSIDYIGVDRGVEVLLAHNKYQSMPLVISILLIILMF